MPTPLPVREAADAERLAADAANHVAAALRTSLAARGVATLAVSGGSSPLRLFQRLATVDLDWRCVHLFQVDERVVPSADAARNWAGQRAALVEPTGAAAHPFTIGPGMPAAAGALVRASDAAVLRRIAGDVPILDVVHLGLGADGHTASWPPGDPADAAWAVDDEVVAAVDDFNGHDRVTLTRGVVNAARSIVWFVPGQQKRAMLARLLKGDESIPAGRVARSRAVVFAEVAALPSNL